MDLYLYSSSKSWDIYYTGEISKNVNYVTKEFYGYKYMLQEFNDGSYVD
jgi:hypothetical protein